MRYAGNPSDTAGFKDSGPSRHKSMLYGHSFEKITFLDTLMGSVCVPNCTQKNIFLDDEREGHTFHGS